MAVLSFIFMNNTVRGDLVRNANSVLDFTEDRIADARLESEAELESFADEARNMVLRGDSAETLGEYIGVLSAFFEDSETSGIQEFFGYFEALPGGAVLVRGSHKDLPAGYRPEDQDWYQQAVGAGGGVTETVPSINGAGETVYTYAKCVYDESGRRLGVVGISAELDVLGRNIVDTALNQGGYGMLINQDGLVLFHPNKDFVGMDFRDPAIPVNVFADALSDGKHITEQSMVSYKGEKSVTFIRTLDNGWRLGLVTPENRYYQGMSDIAAILFILAAILAAILIVILLRLEAAKVKSDEKNRQKSMFLANMSHELRTPINAIVGMTAIGRATGAAERREYCFAKIEDASRHLLNVINDILDVSKIEANKIELSPTDFNFEKMLQQVVNTIAFRVDEKNQKLTVHIDKRIPQTLYADDKRFAQIISNLLSNAVKFTPDKGAIRLTARLLGESKGVYSVQVEVADSGIGLSEEQQAKLFHAFQQAESSTTRKYGGTGLGLSISKSIVEMMGGRIWVTSELGKGSVFTFNVDVKRGDDTKHPLAYQRINWGNIRILTVDDEPDVRESFHEIVHGFGANCDIAADAGEALRLVDEKGSYNVYFIDLRMPGVDGIALTKEIRAREENRRNSIIIMISSADLHAVEDEAKKAGVDKFLLKPIFPSAISDVISECIGIVNKEEKARSLDINGIFEGRRILFAEDIEINREIVSTLLAPTLIHIDCAENGMDAVKMFIKEPQAYDLIFMDVQMPEMDGYEATRQIRALDLPNAKEVPIIAMTANVFKEDVEKCLAAGMNAHLGKPLETDDMFDTLFQYLGDACVKR
jgi:signal transduction histidine kinase/DNA-binding response OmpR family regulator